MEPARRVAWRRALAAAASALPPAVARQIALAAASSVAPAAAVAGRPGAPERPAPAWVLLQARVPLPPAQAAEQQPPLVGMVLAEAPPVGVALAPRPAAPVAGQPRPAEPPAARRQATSPRAQVRRGHSSKLWQTAQCPTAHVPHPRRPKKFQHALKVRPFGRLPMLGLLEAIRLSPRLTACHCSQIYRNKVAGRQAKRRSQLWSAAAGSSSAATAGSTPWGG
jgi:hypothetical protein